MSVREKNQAFMVMTGTALLMVGLSNRKNKRWWVHLKFIKDEQIELLSDMRSHELSSQYKNFH